MRLHISREALDALFPENSEARVELTRSVAVALVEKLAVKEVKHLDGQLQKQVEQAAKKVFDASLKEMGITQGSWGSYNLSVGAERKIKQTAQEEYDRTVREALNRCAAEAAGVAQNFTAERLPQLLAKLDEKLLDAAIQRNLKAVLKGLA